MFGNYDLVLPPIGTTQECEFHLFTDDATLQVDGWTIHHVDLSRFKSPKHANRYYKSTIFEVLQGFDISLYIDANIRVLGSLDAIFAEFEKSGAGFGAYKHPLVNSVAEEVERYLSVYNESRIPEIDEQLDYQKSEGFKDDVGMIEATIHLKNHNDYSLKCAMKLWNKDFQKFGTRDQFGLPFVLWKYEVSIWYQSHYFRDRNPYFGMYPHLKSKRATPLYAIVVARSYSDKFYAIALKLWHFSWSIRRLLRKISLASL